MSHTWTDKELAHLRTIAYIYIRQGVYDVAEKIFQALLLLSPGVAYDLQTLGALHLEQGNNDLALELLDKALFLESSHLPTQLNRAKALSSLGYEKQAKLQLTSLLEVDDEEIRHQAEALLGISSLDTVKV